ncbi:MAG: DUF4382 domain-containing protein, partial [Halobacteriales archaeon]|nr:DUF4382 domain-containing protein [Halobacteriales archaeon]
MDQFASLTVTVTQVAFHRAGSGEEDGETDTNTTDGSSGNETETETNETETPTPTATPTPTTNSTETPTGNTTETATETTESANETTTETESEPEESTEGDAGWITYQVDGREADLTQLRGPNATLVGNYDLPSGKYTMVRVTVESPTGVLNASGETVSVKVPSNRLRINRPFTVGANETLSFVFDITVVEAGGSGKFVLTPVIGQSGTEVPFKAAPGGKPAKAGPPTDKGSARGNNGIAGPSKGAENATLEAEILGKLETGDSATLRVTANNKAVTGATVTVDGTSVGETDDRGRIE